jgi:FkbM family methyltransferase
MARLYRQIPIIKRLYPTLKKKWAALTWVGGYSIKQYKGLILLLNYKNLIDRHIGLHDGYEEEQFSYFLPQVQKSGCDVFLDIGACTGLYSLRVAQLGTVREIHAFEPDPRNFSQMQIERNLNNFMDTITLHELALSDTAGTLQFEMADKNTLTKVSTGKSAPQTLKTIPCRPLDEMLPYKNRKIALKIDVEGHELAVLRGATETLKNNDCFLQVEAWTDNAAAVMQALTALGYKNIHRIVNDYYFVKA